MVFAPSATPHILFIANKRSGTGSHQKVEALVHRVCDKARATHAIEYTKAPRHATELAQEGITKGFTCIVAVGGDGTVNEVAAAVKGSHVPMAIIPAGSGNGLARHLGISMNWEKALQGIFESEPVNIDTFTLNDRLSVNVSGIGFDGHVAAMFGLSKHRGLISYARIALHEYQRFGTFQARLTIEDRDVVHDRAFIIAIANSAQYGNNARVAPQSSVRDGKLNVNVIRKIPLTRLDMVYSLFGGDVTASEWCTMYEAGKVTIRLDRPVRYHIDGEPRNEEDTFVIQINPSSLPVMVPKARKGSL